MKKEVDLSKYQRRSIGVFTFWYNPKTMKLIAFQIFNNRYRFFINQGNILFCDINDDGTLHITLDDEE